MTAGREFRFKINAPYTRDTLPMARLAEYMGDVSVLLGESAGVHFLRLDEGSVVLVQKIEDTAVPKVTDRLERTRRKDGPPEAMAAYKRINDRLRQDNGAGAIENQEGAEILPFPGNREERPPTFGAFTQEGTLDGIVIRLGGRREIVPVHLQAGEIVYETCQANRAVAHRLGAHIFTDELRVRGAGRWYRDEDGVWQLDRFTITDFEVLDDQPLTSVVAMLRATPGSDWDKVADPWAELHKIRGNGEEPS